MGVQFHRVPDQRAELRSRALRYKTSRAATIGWSILCVELVNENYTLGCLLFGQSRCLDQGIGGLRESDFPQIDTDDLG